jgi:hypothetical protein
MLPESTALLRAAVAARGVQLGRQVLYWVPTPRRRRGGQSPTPARLHAHLSGGVAAGARSVPLSGATVRAVAERVAELRYRGAVQVRPYRYGTYLDGEHLEQLVEQALGPRYTYGQGWMASLSSRSSSTSSSRCSRRRGVAPGRAAAGSPEDRRNARSSIGDEDLAGNPAVGEQRTATPPQRLRGFPTRPSGIASRTRFVAFWRHPAPLNDDLRNPARRCRPSRRRQTTQRR